MYEMCVLKRKYIYDQVPRHIHIHTHEWTQRTSTAYYGAMLWGYIFLKSRLTSMLFRVLWVTDMVCTLH